MAVVDILKEVRNMLMDLVNRNLFDGCVPPPTLGVPAPGKSRLTEVLESIEKDLKTIDPNQTGREKNATQTGWSG